MGNMFYIVIAIAVIQAIVGGLAKAKEKRKKSELDAGLRGLQGNQAKKAAGSPGPSKISLQKPPSGIDSERIVDAMSVILGGTPTAKSSPKKPVSSKSPDLEELRRRRIEALRRRQGAPNPAVQAPPTTAPPPPPAPVVPVPQARPRQVQASPAPRASPAPKAEPRQRSRASSKPADIVHKKHREHGKRPSVRNQPTANLASRLRKDLRDPRRFREAFVLAELLQPPVSMRKPDSNR